MKSIVLVAAVAAFEFAFFASVATLPAGTAVADQPARSGQQGLVQRAELPVPCTPRG
jgi:hypothetical protein